MDLSKLSEILSDEPKYRFKQVNQFLFKDYIDSWEKASNLPKSLREQLSQECPLEIKAELLSDKKNDGKKAIITFTDGEMVETVLIKHRDSKTGIFRYTACISTQIGCPMACTFCASGELGFIRNLRSEEMVEQVVFWQRLLLSEEEKTLDNIVFMGMGEPFLNYEEFIKAVKFLNNEETLNIGARRISVSTAGIIPGIKRLAGEKIQINLAISIHAANDSLREKLMPKASNYKIKDIIKAVDDYIKKTGRQVMFEYLMIRNVNDSESDAKELLKLLKKPLYFVNLIPYNDTGKYKPSSLERMKEFKEILTEGGLQATIRKSFGSEINAACGQLRKNIQSKDKKNE